MTYFNIESFNLTINQSKSLNQNQNHHQNQQHFSSNNLKHEHQKNELITKSHAHLRAAFRAIHPDRPAAHVAILKYTHSVLTTYLVSFYL